MPQPRNLCLLGATGSVGESTLSVVREHPDRYQIGILVGCSNAKKIAAQAREFAPSRVVLADEQSAAEAAHLLTGDGIEVDGGDTAVAAAAADKSCCTVVAAIAGAAGIEPALAAAKSGKRLLLANKEALIAAGELLLAAVTDGGGELLPVDSEHCALFELLATDREFESLWLTASGGAVRELPLAALASVTPAMALNHPNWLMGEKITIDSATMMNKALEIIEAALLFRAAPAAIKVVMHPQSIFHALVEYADGAMTASLSLPDMRQPLARMLAWPQRLPLAHNAPTWRDLSEAVFTEPDDLRYPCLALAYEALAVGGGAPAALSAANEITVRRFLANEIKFTDIARINEAVLATASGFKISNISDIWQIDGNARQLAREFAC